MELDSRKQSILQALVLEYVTSAEPVGSELLVQKYHLGVKSATVRHELAEMSELGFLEQPHTSAGRIPSDLGYRYYVDRLIVPSILEDSWRSRLQSTAGAGDALQNVLRDTATALSRLTSLLTVASTYRDRDVTVKSAIISAFGPQNVMLILVLSNGAVINQMVESPSELTLAELGFANEELTAVIAGKPLRVLLKAKAPTTGRASVDRFMLTVWNHIRNQARDLTRGLLITQGEQYLFSQPEFQKDPALMNELLSAFTNSDVLYDAMNSPGETQTVTIGRENKSEKLQSLSLVRASFYVGANEAGVIALVGPTRMRYDTSITLVTYTARALTEALTRFFA